LYLGRPLTPRDKLLPHRFEEDGIISLFKNGGWHAGGECPNCGNIGPDCFACQNCLPQGFLYMTADPFIVVVAEPHQLGVMANFVHVALTAELNPVASCAHFLLLLNMLGGRIYKTTISMQQSSTITTTTAKSWLPRSAALFGRKYLTSENYATRTFMAMTLSQKPLQPRRNSLQRLNCCTPNAMKYWNMIPNISSWIYATSSEPQHPHLCKTGSTRTNPSSWKAL
jgi:hypothetical protein